MLGPKRQSWRRWKPPLQCHVTAVGMGNLPHNGQAKPGPALAAPGRVRPVEPLPDLLLQLGGYSYAVVPYLQQNLATALPNRYPYAPIRLAVFEPVFFL